MKHKSPEGFFFALSARTHTLTTDSIKIALPAPRNIALSDGAQLNFIMSHIAENGAPLFVISEIFSLVENQKRSSVVKPSLSETRRKTPGQKAIECVS
jgi:hypothetical protein